MAKCSVCSSRKEKENAWQITRLFAVFVAANREIQKNETKLTTKK